jgi:flagellar biosynthesis protein FlhB
VFCAGQKWILARRGPAPKQKEVLSQSAIVGILVTAILVVTVVAVSIYIVVKNRYSLLSKIFILNHNKFQSNTIKIFYSSTNSITCFGLILYHQVD